MAEGERAKRLLVPLGLAASLSLFGDLSLFAGLVTRLELVQLTLAQVGILLSIHRFIRIPGNPIVGIFMERSGRRKLFLLGMTLAVLSSVGYAFLRGFFPFMLARLAWGTAWALINVGSLTMIMDVSTTETRGRLVGLLNSWVWAGYGIGPLIGGVLVDAIGFQAAMLVCAACSAVGLLAALFFLPETMPERQGEAGGPAAPHVTLWQGLVGVWQSGVSAVRSSPAVLTAMILFSLTLFASDGVMLSTVSVLLEERLGKAISIGGLVLGVASASGILIALRSFIAGVSGPVAGRLSDVRLGRVPTIAASFVLGIAAFGLLSFSGSLPLMVLGLITGAVSSGAAIAVLAAYMGDATQGGQHGASMGLYAMAGDIGSATGPALAFALIPLLGLEAVYLFSGLLFAAGLGLLLLRRSPASKGETAVTG